MSDHILPSVDVKDRGENEASFIDRWFRSFLEGRFQGCDIDVRDTHMRPLNDYISRNDLRSYFDSDNWQSYNIRVGCTAFVKGSRIKGIAFLDYKTIPISPNHVFHLLGYSRVATPLVSYLISPAGIGGIVRSLLLSYDRSDILEYHWPKGGAPRRMTLARWDAAAKSLDATTILPPGG